MDIDKFLATAFFLAFLGFFITLLFYDKLPSKMTVHWNINGRPDGYSKKEFGAFTLPLVNIIVLIIMVLLPKIDPLRKNFEEFKTDYSLFLAFFSAFMLFIHLLVLGINLGYAIPINQGIAFFLGLVLIATSRLLAKAKQNWFVGIRTPWTLSSKYVWNMTHLMGAKLFFTCGILTLTTALLLPDQAIVISSTAIVIATIILIFYSYLIFKQKRDE